MSFTIHSYFYPYSSRIEFYAISNVELVHF